MNYCNDCGKKAISMSFSKKDNAYIFLCDECRQKRRNDEIEERLKKVTQAYDFKDWTPKDMSEAFWIHLGIYQKRPNKYSLNVMSRAFAWACHDNHGLSNSFSHALKWCGIDMYSERKKDLPEE